MKHISKSTILSFIAVGGVIGTAVLSTLATPKAIRRLEGAKMEDDDLSKFDKAKILIPVYTPTILVGTGTVICILGANSLNKKQQAALISAYNVLECSFNQYKDKLQELYGKEAHNNIMDAIIKEDCKDVPISSYGFLGSSTLDPGVNQSEVKRTFYDYYSKRYFDSTLSKVIEAEYSFNRNFMIGGSNSLNEFYEFLGLDFVENGDLLGWNISEGIYWIDFNHRLVTLEDGMEVISVEMVFDPIMDYLED